MQAGALARQTQRPFLTHHPRTPTTPLLPPPPGHPSEPKWVNDATRDLPFNQIQSPLHQSPLEDAHHATFLPIARSSRASEATRDLLFLLASPKSEQQIIPSVSQKRRASVQSLLARSPMRVFAHHLPPDQCFRRFLNAFRNPPPRNPHALRYSAGVTSFFPGRGNVALLMKLISRRPEALRAATIRTSATRDLEIDFETPFGVWVTPASPQSAGQKATQRDRLSPRSSELRIESEAIQVSFLRARIPARD